VKMGIYAVGPSGQAQIGTYLKTAARIKPGEEWPGMEKIGQDTVSCAELEVIFK
jgi:hypothetical protein